MANDRKCTRFDSICIIPIWTELSILFIIWYKSSIDELTKINANFKLVEFHKKFPTFTCSKRKKNVECALNAINNANPIFDTKCDMKLILEAEIIDELAQSLIKIYHTVIKHSQPSKLLYWYSHCNRNSYVNCV